MNASHRIIELLVSATSSFLGGPNGMSLLQFYAHHTTRLFSTFLEIIFLQYRETLKCINHAKKIEKFPHSYEPWFQNVFDLSCMKYFLCRTRYGYIHHDLLSAFIERIEHKDIII